MYMVNSRYYVVLMASEIYQIYAGDTYGDTSKIYTGDIYTARCNRVSSQKCDTPTIV